MAKKIFLSPSNQEKNSYAYGNTTEDVQCGKIAKAAEVALKRCGFEVRVEQYDTMQNRVKHSEAWGADLHVPIHTNAFDGKVGGTRIFYNKKGSEGHKAAQAIYDALKVLTPGKADAIGYYNLYEIRVPKIPAAYIEAEFHDVPEYAKWIIEHTTEIGEAICKGICAYFGVSYKAAGMPVKKPENADSAVKYRVQVGAFAVREYADNLVKKLKAAGFDAIIVEVGDNAPEDRKVKKGDTVKVKPNAKTYDGGGLASFVYGWECKVSEVKGDRVVITHDGVVIAAVHADDLIVL